MNIEMAFSLQIDAKVENREAHQSVELIHMLTHVIGSVLKRPREV